MFGDFIKKTNRSRSKRNQGKSALPQRKALASGKSIISRKCLYYCPFVLVVVLGILQVYFSNKLATRGKISQEFEEKIIQLEKENQQIRSEVARQGGLNELTLQATKKGFIKNPAIVNFSSKIPVALHSR